MILKVAREFSGGRQEGYILPEETQRQKGVFTALILD
jgi:hypothetical protein